MKKNLLLVIFVILLSSSVFASMSMPRYGINEETKECSEFFTGDECKNCTLPEGWHMIEEFQCPTDYKEIQKDSVCTPIKNSFCCTVQHSGSSGDCEDVVVNDVEQKCAFVEDINECGNLPKNWKQAEENESWGRICPSLEYGWLEDSLNCEVKTIENESDDNQNNIIENESDDNQNDIIENESDDNQNDTIENESDDNQNNVVDDKKEDSNIIPIIGILAGIIISLIILGFFLSKRKQK